MTRFVIEANETLNEIKDTVYGHFAEHLGRCIYDGIYVGEDSTLPHQDGMRRDVVEALRGIRIPVLRWPGGCFADEYHWKDGVGPRALRKPMINTHWGGDVEDNSFGTHEFMTLIEQLGCKAYFAGNVGSGTVQEMQEWVEYLTFSGPSPMAQWRQTNGRDDPWPIAYFGIGNENWACGGNMRASFYADLCRQFQTYVRSFGENAPEKIACGATGYDFEWTQALMQQAAPFIDGLSLHHYTICGSQENKGSATAFSETDWYVTLSKALAMHNLIEKHGSIMDRFDPAGRVKLIVDEWGTWHDPEPDTRPEHLHQQNTMRDALVAGVTLNVFNKLSRRVHMANLAQTINVLQSVILTQGSQMVLTPTYHVFDLYQSHQGAQLLQSRLEDLEYVGLGSHPVPRLTESASRDHQGSIHITLCHLDARDPIDLDVDIEGGSYSVEAAWSLTGNMHDHNTFVEPDKVQPQSFNGFQMQKATEAKTRLKVSLPARSIVRLSLGRVRN